MHVGHIHIQVGTLKMGVAVTIATSSLLPSLSPTSFVSLSSAFSFFHNYCHSFCPFLPPSMPAACLSFSPPSTYLGSCSLAESPLPLQAAVNGVDTRGVMGAAPLLVAWWVVVSPSPPTVLLPAPTYLNSVVTCKAAEER